MSDIAHGTPEERKSRWIPWAFVGFFLVIFAVNGIMLTFALKSFNGLWTDGAYDRGLSYNEELAGRAHQVALGWEVAANVAHLGGQRSQIVLSAFGAEERPLPGTRIEAIARRPTSAGMDFPITFRQSGRGIYEAMVDWPLPGQWEVRITVESGSSTYRLDKRLMVR